MLPQKCFLIVFLVFLTQTAYCQNDTITIFYDIGVSKLSKQQQHKINNYIEKLEKEVVYTVEIISSADYLGTITSNESLARKRAKIINSFLKNKNEYTFKKFKLKNLGEISNLDTITSNDGIAEHRRTLIIFKREEEKVTIKVKEKIKPKRKKFSEYNDLEIGKKFVIKNLIFKIGTDKLLKKSYSPLIRLARFLNENPTIEIEIIGHLCCNAGYRNPDSEGNIIKYNGNDLSTKRAKFVYKYLYFKGVNKKRMSFYGYGFQKPLFYPEKSNKEMRANKRVEIKIIKL